ncbi:MAG: twin-arginine translocation signal domain-containing protein, partial [Silicimonas sp.]|nr:twin-arginine translocation signal domain-containing protein [Silicimonas sp.]
MPLSRRSFLAGTAAAPLIGALPSMAISEMAIGSGRLTTVSDGNLV